MWLLIVVISITANPSMTDKARQVGVFQKDKVYWGEVACKADAPLYIQHLHGIYGDMDMKVEHVFCDYEGEET